MKKELILDYSTWRCGDFGENQLGKGDTYLLNDEGFMCCLGQFTPQINNFIIKDEMLGVSDPSDLGEKVLSLNKKENRRFRTTRLSDEAININDDTCSTPEEKIKALQRVFKKEGYTINVINQPK